ncbi:MAG: 16S rRNA (cytosine(967)-C(5))-methyltransferase, partial [Pseudomonadales bacterium]|nr:16S rRNA (cytosine(967)-C(5))-methyltransferase [Pseudomonadales bacterium]
MTVLNSRAIAAKVIAEVLPLSRKGEFHGRSLNDALPDLINKFGDEEKSLIQALCFGICRHYTWLDQIANQLIRQAFKPKDADLHALLLVGLYQLYFMRIPDHAAISETVEAARQLEKAWAVKVINGMLRNAQRDKDILKEAISDSVSVQTSHPKWLVDALTTAWP